MMIRCDDTSLQVSAEEEDRIISKSLLDELAQWYEKARGRKEFAELVKCIEKRVEILRPK